MESRKRIGLYGSGDVPRSRRLMSRSVGPKSKSLRDLEDLPPIRRMRPKLATRTVAAAVAAPLVVVIMIVTAVMLATSSVPVQKVGTKVPGPPFSVMGFTFDDSGAFLPDVPCTITNLRTGESIPCQSDPSFGLIVSLSTGSYPDLANELPSGYAEGDVIQITAEKAGWTGDNQTTLTGVAGKSSIWMNVTLDTPPIPEFSEVALPIAGMVGMFLVVAVATKSRKDE